MNVTHKLRLDLVRREIPPRVDVVQDDKFSRSLAISLYENGKAFCPSEGCGVLIRYRKADGIAGAYDTLPDGTAGWVISENLLVIRLAPQVCTTAGTVDMMVTLLRGHRELSCFGLQLEVHALPGGIGPSREYVNITHYLPQVDHATAGQFLKVKSVDGSGRIAVLETAEVEIPDNLVTCDLDGSTGDESAVPVNADTLGGELPEFYTKSSVVEDFTSLVTFNETPANCYFVKVGNMVFIQYQGENVAHALNDALFTVPEGYRPMLQAWTTATFYADGYAAISINTTGVCGIGSISAASVSGRTYFQIAYVCENAEVTEVRA